MTTFKDFLLAEKISKSFMIPIIHERFVELSISISGGKGEYSIYTGAYAKTWMTSLDAAFHFHMQEDSKVLELVRYIISEITEKRDFRKLTVVGITKKLKQIIGPIIKNFQQPEDTEGMEESDLADRIDNLKLPFKVKNAVLEELDELEEYLPPNLALLPDDELKDVVHQIYLSLQSHDLDTLMKRLQQLGQ